MKPIVPLKGLPTEPVPLLRVALTVGARVDLDGIADRLGVAGGVGNHDAEGVTPRNRGRAGDSDGASRRADAEAGRQGPADDSVGVRRRAAGDGDRAGVGLIGGPRGRAQCAHGRTGGDGLRYGIGNSAGLVIGAAAVGRRDRVGAHGDEHVAQGKGGGVARFPRGDGGAGAQDRRADLEGDGAGDQGAAAAAGDDGALKVTAWLTSDGLGMDDSVVVVEAGFTVRLIVLVDGAKKLSPP